VTNESEVHSGRAGTGRRHLGVTDQALTVSATGLLGAGKIRRRYLGVGTVWRYAAVTVLGSGLSTNLQHWCISASLDVHLRI